MRICRYIIIALCIFIPLANNAAQAQTQQAERETERLQRQQELQQQRDRDRALQDRNNTEFNIVLPELPEDAEGNCFQVQTIDITGSTLLPEKTARDIASPYEHTCINVRDIEQILSKLTSYFIENGYTTTRGYIPEQDLISGTLRIEVVDGVVEDVEVKDEEDKQSRIYLRGAFGDKQGDIFNIWDFEQGLENINRLRANNATLDVRPGAKSGSSIVEIYNDPKFPLYATLSYDNTGISSTGRRQVSGSLSGDSLLGLNEFFNYTKRESFPIKKEDKFSTSESYIFSIPYNNLLWTSSYSDSFYESQLVQPVNDFELSGRTRNISTDLQYAVYRDQNDIVKLNLGFTHKRSRNYFEDQLLTVSSRKLSVVDMGVNYSRDIEAGYVSLDFGYFKGLRILDAQEDAAGAGNNVPKAEFNRFTLNINAVKGFRLFDKDLTYSGNFSGQYSLQTLYGSEQVSVGGPFSVRGFLNDSIVNDHGFYFRNEIIWPNAYNIPFYAGKNYNMAFSPYVGFDLGGVTGRVQKTDNGMLGGGTLGVRANMNELNIDAYATTHLFKPDSVTDEGELYFISITTTF